MPTVEMIRFLEGEFPQYPDCEFGERDPDKHYLKDGEWVEIVRCRHKKSKNKLCSSNQIEGVCPL